VSFTAAEVLEEVRELVQDTTTAYLRYSDAFLLRKLNQAMKRFAIIRPDLFAAYSPLVCAGGSMQVAPADSIRLMDVIDASDGSAVKEVSPDAVDLMLPQWANGEPGTAKNWVRYGQDPNRFYLYPPAVPGDTLTILYARTPVKLNATGDVVPVDDVYFPVVIDCTTWLVESIDAESVTSGRAKTFKDSFIEMISASLQARALTDTDTAGRNKKEVLS